MLNQSTNPLLVPVSCGENRLNHLKCLSAEDILGEDEYFETPEGCFPYILLIKPEDSSKVLSEGFIRLRDELLPKAFEEDYTDIIPEFLDQMAFLAAQVDDNTFWFTCKTIEDLLNTVPQKDSGKTFRQAVDIEDTAAYADYTKINREYLLSIVNALRSQYLK